MRKEYLYAPEQQLIQAENNVWNDSTSWAGCNHDILHAEIGQVTNERPCSARVRKRIAPEYPLKGRHRRNHQTLEEHGKRRLAACKTSIEETNAGDDKPDNEGAEDEIRVMVLEASILGIDIDGEDVTALGLTLVEGGLEIVSIRFYKHNQATISSKCDILERISTHSTHDDGYEARSSNTLVKVKVRYEAVNLKRGKRTK